MFLYMVRVHALSCIEARAYMCCCAHTHFLVSVEKIISFFSRIGDMKLFIKLLSTECIMFINMEQYGHIQCIIFIGMEQCGPI
jgi:hypothetical protein